MKFNTLTRRAAAAAGATALVGGALVGLTVSSASAVDPYTVDNTYTCSAPVGSPFPVFLHSSATNIGLVHDAGVGAGYQVIAGLLPVSNTFTIPAAVHDFMASVHVDSMTFTNFAGTFGPVNVPVDGMAANFSDFVANGDSSAYSAPADGTNAAFNAPAAGLYNIVSPAGFSLNAHTDDGAGHTGTLPVTCVIQDGTSPGAYSDLLVYKNASTTAASSNTPVKHGAKAVLKAKVTADNHMPTGKVTFKDGTHKLGSASLNAKGIAILKVKLSVGTHKKIKMSYAGDGYSTKSSATTKVVQK